jgi:predicted nucleic acid-binding Zn finger protein
LERRTLAVTEHLLSASGKPRAVTGVDDDRGSGREGDDSDAAPVDDVASADGTDATPAGEGDAADSADEDVTPDSMDDVAPDSTEEPTPDSTDGDDAPDPADDWRTALAETGRLTPAIVDAIVSTHGDRGQRAIEAVSEGRVKQYRDFTVVVGHDDEYIVEDGGCMCKDAEYNLAPDDPDQRCWHSLAVDVAEGVGAVDYHDMWYSEVREFL